MILRRLIAKKRDHSKKSLGIAFTGGGARAAYQVGVLAALAEKHGKEFRISVVTGSSVGAINSYAYTRLSHLPLSQTIELMAEVWRRRAFSNTFGGAPSVALFNAVKLGLSQYFSPGLPSADTSMFNPDPLRREIEDLLKKAQKRLSIYRPSLGVMTTAEGSSKAFLFVEKRPGLKLDTARSSFTPVIVDNINLDHVFASAALPSVLPPVEFELESKQVRLIDGGIADNIPVDPAVRMGAQKVITIDACGRRWWHNYFEQPEYTPESWMDEDLIGSDVICRLPVKYLHIGGGDSFGEVLAQALGSSTRTWIRALGPIWPLYKLAKLKFGEVFANEVMSYVVVHPLYSEALIAKGKQDGSANVGDFFEPC